MRPSYVYFGPNEFDNTDAQKKKKIYMIDSHLFHNDVAEKSHLTCTTDYDRLELLQEVLQVKGHRGVASSLLGIYVTNLP